IVAAAAGDVEPVARRVLLVVILVIVLGGPEFARRHDRRQDRLPERLVFLPLRLGGVSEALLLVAVIENCRAVLRAGVAELTVGRAGTAAHYAAASSELPPRKPWRRCRAVRRRCRWRPPETTPTARRAPRRSGMPRAAPAAACLPPGPRQNADRRRGSRP